MHCNTVL
jgi:hypothetical protein